VDKWSFVYLRQIWALMELPQTQGPLTWEWSTISDDQTKCFAWTNQDWLHPKSHVQFRIEGVSRVRHQINFKLLSGLVSEIFDWWSNNLKENNLKYVSDKPEVVTSLQNFFTDRELCESGPTLFLDNCLSIDERMFVHFLAPRIGNETNNLLSKQCNTQHLLWVKCRKWVKISWWKFSWFFMIVGKSFSVWFH